MFPSACIVEQRYLVPKTKGGRRRGKQGASWCVVSFKERHLENRQHSLYDLQVVKRFSIEMNGLFVCMRAIIDMEFFHGEGPSFLKLYCNVPLLMQAKDSQFSFLSWNSEPILSSVDHRSLLLKESARNQNVELMVLILCWHLKPKPTAVREQYRHILTLFDRPWTQTCKWLLAMTLHSCTTTCHCVNLSWNWWYSCASWTCCGSASRQSSRPTDILAVVHSQSRWNLLSSCYSHSNTWHWRHSQVYRWINRNQIHKAEGVY